MEDQQKPPVGIATNDSTDAIIVAAIECLERRVARQEFIAVLNGECVTLTTRAWAHLAPLHS